MVSQFCFFLASYYACCLEKLLGNSYGRISRGFISHFPHNEKQALEIRIEVLEI